MSKFRVIPSQSKCWWLIENGLDIDLLYPEHLRAKSDNPKYITYLESVLNNGEEYILLDDDLFDYALTSYGRVINCKTQNCKVSSIMRSVKDNGVRVEIRNKKILLRPIFKEQGWSFDPDKILKQYEK
jgi:hypothetical protein